MWNRRLALSTACLLLACCFAVAQSYVPPSIIAVHHQEIRLDLHPAVAAPAKPAVVSAVETVLGNSQLCCGQESTLGDAPIAEEHVSLRNLGDKLAGRHTLADGRAVMISSSYVPADSVTSDRIIAPLRNHHPMLMQWNGHVYVVDGVNYDEDVYTDDHKELVIRKILLLDPSAAADSQETDFDRTKDDWSKVQGFLLLKVTPQ